MKHLIIFLIIILGILIIKCATIETFNNSTVDYIQPSVNLKYSYQIEGRGAFATKNYAKGEVLEVCPGILQKTEDVKGRVRDYLFSYDNDNSMIGFGYCSMYNHSDTPNATWKVLDAEKIKITATEEINAGDEIFVSYGDEYWKTRQSDLDKK